MRTLAILLAFFGLVTLPISFMQEEKVSPIIGYVPAYGYRIAPPPRYFPGRVFNSGGGYLREFHSLKAQLRHSHQLVRLGWCASACTMLLSLPNACVEPNGRFLFHAARREGQIDLDGTAEMFREVPPRIRGMLRAPFDGLDQVLTGAQLIMSGGARPCPY